ncbi:hypothetical protein A1O1_07438 [Capronia coronata CBS 617.96]|uniref:Myb-like DNA-binding domain-containing protein n=1 Tax=Capronia coronata CBS 617.96 TaxID=1182541 RepID=W9Y3J1_9EURO|nr:uncharacterized protein A1O1_07438 [Capronia coronata CBS 617.96]EXJ83811.1 hypothetical protein A1O1_07438 [Capronia coronata CBS 617.96]
MPPKADGGKAVVSNDTFLVACIKHGKDKLSVNFDTLAKDLNMSAGGAANKFRSIMKQFENEGAAWANKDPAAATPPRTKAPAGTKRKAPLKKEASEDDDSEEEAPEEPPKKKARGKGAKAKSVAVVEASDAPEGDDVDDAMEKKPKGRGGKAKATTAGGPKRGGKKTAPKDIKEESAEEPIIKEEEAGNVADDESDDDKDAVKTESSEDKDA